MDDRVFKYYRILLNKANTDFEKELIGLAFDLGISEGISQCTEKLGKV